MIYLNLLFIAIITSILTGDKDICGLMDDVKAGLSYILSNGKIKKTNYSLKPFDCAFCMNFWIGIILVICTGLFSLLILAYILLLSVLTTPIQELIRLIKNLILKIISIIYEKFID